MVDMKPGYCECGCEMWVEYLWNGKEYEFRYTDQDFREITHCPDCGLELNEDDLESW